MVLMASCNTVTAPADPTNNLPDGSVAATVDGSYWQSTQIPLVSGGAEAIRKPAAGTISIAGTKVTSTSDAQVLSLNLSRLGTDTDTLGLLNIGTFSTGKASNQTWASAGINAGIATVTKYDTVNKLISGTFYFSAINTDMNTKQITNGTFKNVPWKDQ